MPGLVIVLAVLGAVAAAAGLFNAWRILRRSVIDSPEKQRQLSLLPTDQRDVQQAIVEPLIPSSPAAIYRSLAQQNPLVRFYQITKHLLLSRDTRTVIENDTRLLEVQGIQHTTVLEKRNEIQRLVNDAEILPFRQMQEISALLAEIAENELRAAEAKNKIRSFSQQSVPRDQEDPMDKLEREWRAILEKSVVGRQDVYDRIRRGAETKYKDNDRMLRIFLDKLDHLFEQGG